MNEQSHNSWIKRDFPSYVTSMASRKDTYTDILGQRRVSSDLRFVTKSVPESYAYKYRIKRSPSKIKEDILSSDRVKYQIEALCSEKNLKHKEVLEEARHIMDEMGHNLSLKAVRSFAFALIKVFKALFDRIYVNLQGIQELGDLLKEYPVLFMPSHRSYLDFLLVSYVCFNFNFPLPAIAAAMDFKDMKFFGWLLRSSGAFYIRRSFGADKLYWAIFTEYVQSQLRNGDSPIEFFVEGTRSRTNKSYQPKIGMLSAALESFFKAEIPDLMVVPISISYERVLEENLYAYELLGVPKPKESASGVFKARSILEESYGNVHIHIGRAISIRHLSGPHVDRVLHSLEPRYINSLLPSEVDLANRLATALVLEQQAGMVVSPFSLMATVLMQNPDGISITELCRETEWIKRQAQNLGAYVDWPGNAKEDLAIIWHYLNIQKSLTVVHDNVVMLRKLDAPSLLKLASYRNQVTHIFVRTAILSTVVFLCDQNSLSLDELFQRCCCLRDLFCQEFVFDPVCVKQDFDYAVRHLTACSSLHISDDRVLIKQSVNKHVMFLSQMFQPFLMCEWLTCAYLLSLPSDMHGRVLPQKPKLMCQNAQMFIKENTTDYATKWWETLSLDMINNSLLLLAAQEALYKDKRYNEVYLSPKKSEVAKFQDRVGAFLDLPQFLLHKKAGYIVPAKL